MVRRHTNGLTTILVLLPAWVNANKCISLASSFACMTVSQLNMLSDVWAVDAIHIEPTRGAGRLSHRFSYLNFSNILQPWISFCSFSFFSVQSCSRGEFSCRASSYFLGCCFFNLWYYRFLLDSIVTGQVRSALPYHLPLAGNGRFDLIRSYSKGLRSRLPMASNNRRSTPTVVRVFDDGWQSSNYSVPTTIPPEFSRYQTEVGAFNHTSWQEECFMGFLE